MKRAQLYSQLLSRLREPRRFIQVLAGPRQVGKTTLTRQVMEASGLAAQRRIKMLLDRREVGIAIDEQGGERLGHGHEGCTRAVGGSI